MKKILQIIVAVALSGAAMAQGNSKGKGHGNGNGNGNGKQHESNEVVVINNEGNGNHGNGKPNNMSQVNPGNSKHQPKKVEAALLRDYPGANNIRWSKYKGYYMATFNNGVFRSTAVYHANGERRDTRTVLSRNQLPGSIWDKIFKRDNIVPVGYVQIEQPSTVEKIFRILTGNNTAYYYNQNGTRVSYNY